MCLEAVRWALDSKLSRSLALRQQSGPTCSDQCQTRRQVGFEGFERTPVWPPKDFINTALTVHFKCPTIAKWSTSSLAAIENHRCASKSGCSYAGLFLEDQRRTRAREPFTPLWWKLRPRVNTCVNNSLWQAREFTSRPSIDVTPPTVLPTLVPSLVEIGVSIPLIPKMVYSVEHPHLQTSSYTYKVHMIIYLHNVETPYKSCISN